jgi:hypothetical protein
MFPNASQTVEACSLEQLLLVHGFVYDTWCPCTRMQLCQFMQVDCYALNCKCLPKAYVTKAWWSGGDGNCKRWVLGEELQVIGSMPLKGGAGLWMLAGHEVSVSRHHTVLL